MTTRAGASLRSGFGGKLWLPGEEGYDAARLAWNRGLDPLPAIVAEAESERDVALAIAVAREYGLPFAVQSTGHGTVVPADNGLLLKTSRMADVHVDPVRRIAKVGPGALWADVISAAAPYGLVPVSGTPSVGVAGYTLGGGAGFLSRLHGYAADNLLRVRLVTAEAELITADADQNAELFWAVRGGSGNFGVVTSLEVRLHPVDNVYAGLSFYEIERAEEVLGHYAEWALGEPDELNTAVMLVRMPPGRLTLGIRVFYAGRYEEVEQRLEPLLKVAGEPVADGFRCMSFAEAGQVIAPPAPPTAAVSRFDLFHELSDEVLAAVVSAMTAEDSSLAGIEVRHWGGAMSRPAPDAGPVGHRDVPFSIAATAIGQGLEVAESVGRLARRLQPYATGGSFLNFLTDVAKTASAFTERNYARLREVKRTWDPDNCFRLNHNIPPKP